MQHIKTIILHLHTELEHRGKICGNLQALPERKVLTFKTHTELINLLQHITHEEIDDLSLKGSQNENETK